MTIKDESFAKKAYTKLFNSKVASILESILINLDIFLPQVDQLRPTPGFDPRYHHRASKTTADKIKPSCSRFKKRQRPQQKLADSTKGRENSEALNVIILTLRPK